MLTLPRIIGHRGARAHAPENTLSGIRTAARLGARWIEVDVKLTRDAVPVLMHDDMLDRTTDGRGPVKELDLADLRRLDAGSWFGPQFGGERVPVLDEVLALCGELGLGINIEIKPCPGREAETARAALERLRAFPAGLPVLVSSFALESLEETRRRAPDLPVGYLFEGCPEGWLETARRLGARTLNVEGGQDRRVIERFVASGLPVLAWTVNDAARARDLLDAGVVSVITDRPGDMLAAAGG
jgi:glycerophosphoryl diester phosphodiesterase